MSRTRATRALARLGSIVALAAVASSIAAPAVAHAEARVELEAPRDRTKLRGEPAQLEVAVAPSTAVDRQVEVDGRVRASLLPWRRRVELTLAPGIHRVAVRGRDPDSGERLRSETALVVVFPEQARAPLDPRRRHALSALVAFALAVFGAAALRRRGW
jgi:hypothetical protein